MTYQNLTGDTLVYLRRGFSLDVLNKTAKRKTVETGSGTTTVVVHNQVKDAACCRELLAKGLTKDGYVLTDEGYRALCRLRS